MRDPNVIDLRKLKRQRERERANDPRLPRNSLGRGMAILLMINVMLPILLRGIVDFFAGLGFLPVTGSFKPILVIAAAIVVNGLNVWTLVYYRPWGVRVLGVALIAANLGALVLLGAIAAFPALGALWGFMG